MAYKVNIGRELVDISRKDFIAVNNKLSTQYHEERDPERKRKIVALLYDLDKKMFKDWRVYGEENKKDYGQEAYFWIIAALETFKPGAGSFISWLKWYILKAQEEVKKAGNKAALTGPEVELTAPIEPPDDSIYWKRIKSKCNSSEWILLSHQILQGYTLTEAAESAKLTLDQAKGRYSALLKRLKTEIAIPVQHGPQNKIQPLSAENSNGSKWLQKKELCEKLNITPAYLKDLLNKKRPMAQAPYYIDPRDILDIGRIRYLETEAGGLIYPRILRKKKAPKPGASGDI
jgi:hypothetical protein